MTEVILTINYLHNPDLNPYFRLKRELESRGDSMTNIKHYDKYTESELFAMNTMSDNELEALSKQIREGRFHGDIDLGKDPEGTLKSICQNGKKGLYSIWERQINLG